MSLTAGGSDCPVVYAGTRINRRLSRLIMLTAPKVPPTTQVNNPINANKNKSHSGISMP
jgi:hypothetical protein